MPAVFQGDAGEAFQSAENPAKVARTMAAVPVSIGDVIAGKYIVERVIGEGGMGVVVAARHRELEQRVAIKFLLPEIAEQGMAAERFRREARSAARMRGAHVCRVLDVGTAENGVPFMVMEYLEGWDLATELERRSRLPHVEAVGHLLQACEALAEAHAAGVIHRDLKPANLFLESCADGSRRIKVLDFGVSKSLLDATPGLGALTKTSNLVGSPLYMSPEQLDSAKDVDPRTDVWALGIVLYELIAGRTPFTGESIPQLVTAVLHDAPRKLSELDVHVPDGLESVMQRALAKPRNDRYGSVAELVNALMPFAPPQAAGAAGRVSRLLSLAEPLAVGSLDAARKPIGATPSGSLPLAAPPTPTPSGDVSTPLAWTRSQSRRKLRLGLSLGALLLLGLLVAGFYALRAPTGSVAAETIEKPAVPAANKEPSATANGPAAATRPEPVPASGAITSAQAPSEPPSVLAGEGIGQAAAPAAPAKAESAAAPASPVPAAAAQAEPARVPAPPALAEPTREPVTPSRARDPERRPEPARAPKLSAAPIVSPAPISDFGGRR